MKFREMTTEQLCEESFIDLGYAILEEKHESLTLQELLDEIQALNGFKNVQMKKRTLQYYTDMNIDGRFLAISENRWGLREWYPVEQIEEETAPTVKVRKKKSKASAGDDDLDDTDDDEILFEEDFDEFVEDADVDEEDFDDEDDDEEEVKEIEVEVAVDLIETDDEFEIVEDEEDDEEDEE